MNRSLKLKLSEMIAVIIYGFIFTLMPLFYGYISLLYYLLTYITLALSLNLLIGYANYVNFGYAVFYGIGAVVFAYIYNVAGGNIFIAFISAIAVNLLIAYSVGYVTLKTLKGAYFAIAWLGFSEAMRYLFIWLFPFGIFLPPQIYNPYFAYYTALITSVIMIVLTLLLERSDYGLALRAIGDDEIAAASRGINIFKQKMLAHMLSSIPAGILGAVDAIYSTYIDVISISSPDKTVRIIAMIMFGGAGTLLGPIIGSAVLYLIEYIFWARFPFLHLLIYGSIIAIMTLYIPKGLVGSVKKFLVYQTKH
jgi:branched-chain amino acid transport system permease protein